jgi:hypothetical protein
VRVGRLGLCSAPVVFFTTKGKTVARIRTIKPEFFTSEDIVGLSAFARLFYIALWCEADREGRLVWRTGTYKLRYFPADRIDIEALGRELVERGLVVLYDGDGLAYIPTFLAHQNVNPREAASKLPAPPVHDASNLDQHASSRVTDASNLDQHAQGGREGKGKEGEEDASRRVARKGSRLPPAWQPSEVLKAWALKERADLDLKSTTEKFVDHWSAVPGSRGSKLDWDATFRNWVRTERAVKRDGTVPVTPSPMLTKMCAYCGNPASGGMTSGIWHCHEHFDDAMAQKPRPKVAA